MAQHKLSRRKFLGYLGAGLVTVTAVSLPIKAFAGLTGTKAAFEVNSEDLPKEPGTWGDTILDMENELPQDPNVLLMDVEAIYKLNQ
ncbi:twin-arginine translocation signal domain-containing protein [Metabacillus dongyingensis]|uniref:twin-arginine translocation signal domain-containing protein n=1 Tax=Metabacillus dongyingensis TaxID=2874282 RepID=UPI003B8C7B5D